MSGKLLSREELDLVTADTYGLEQLRAHIAALEKERDAALADNAALLSAVNDVLNYVHMHSPDMGGNHRYSLLKNHGPAVARLQYVASDAHPSAALLEEHRKALVRARNEGSEQAADMFDHEANSHADFQWGRTCAGIAARIRAMKDPEPTEPA